jgi:GH25 family lysozyme M1 (1,4-beta-N-acetylmuramidase)
MRTAQLLVLALTLSLAVCRTGFDISMYQGAVGQDTFSCLLNQGYDFAIIQAWCGGYGINSNFASNVENAKNAGIPYVDVYAFACNNCDENSPSDVVSQIQNNLPSDFDGMLWFDVEPCTDCWLSDSSNLDYINSLVTTAQGYGFNVGIYSSLYSWQSVVGSDGATTAAIEGVPLWYAHYDGSGDFDDSTYYEFGGWSSPNIKQFSDGGDACGLSFDSDWYPSS